MKSGEYKKILFITQKIHEDDDDLAFVTQWVDEFIRQGFDVQVICLEKGVFNNRFPVFSLKKEDGSTKAQQVLTFLKYVFSLKYDAVFVHMNPEYITLAGWFWKASRKPIYLWYTHYSMHIHMRIAGLLCKRMFAATEQSMPQFTGNPKKIITGHGLDISFWIKEFDPKTPKNQTEIIAVHRICRSKRVELAIKSLLLLPESYTLKIYGRDVETDYAAELRSLVKESGLEGRVTFCGPVPMWQLKDVYPKHQIMINMAPGTIDKTMIESMLFGIFPVTTEQNSKDIGLNVYPEGETPDDLARFIQSESWRQYSIEQLQTIIKERHSLSSLIKKLRSFIWFGK